MGRRTTAGAIHGSMLSGCGPGSAAKSTSRCVEPWGVSTLVRGLTGRILVRRQYRTNSTVTRASASREPTTEPTITPVLDSAGALSDWVGVGLLEVVSRGTHSVNVAVVVNVPETEVVSMSQKVLLALEEEEAIPRSRRHQGTSYIIRVYYNLLYIYSSVIKISSTSCHCALPPSLKTRSRSAQYSSRSPRLDGCHTRSPVSSSTASANHRGLCGGSSPASRFRRVARWNSSCIDLRSLARSYRPLSNARWSGRMRQSVGGRYGASVSGGQSFNVIANGVRLKGAVGFSVFFQSNRYWLVELSASGRRSPAPVPAGRASNWLFQRPAISHVTRPDAS